MRARRFIASTTATILVTAALAVSGSLPASACDLRNHCYGITAYNRSYIVGIRATIQPSSITAPSGNFSTNEIWLLPADANYWVEVGFIANYANVNGANSGLNEFWYDSRPGSGSQGGQHGHNLVTNPSFKPHQFSILQSGSTSYVASDGTYSGTSTSNGMTPYTSEVGSEVTSASACTYSHDYSMGYSIGSGWSNLPEDDASAPDSPQVVQWNTKWTDMNAGVPC